jgi:hypothetical protein
MSQTWHQLLMADQVLSGRVDVTLVLGRPGAGCPEHLTARTPLTGAAATQCRSEESASVRGGGGAPPPVVSGLGGGAHGVR